MFVIIKSTKKENKKNKDKRLKQIMIKRNSHTGTRTRVAEVKTRYPNRLDYMGPVFIPLISYLRHGMNILK